MDVYITCKAKSCVVKHVISFVLRYIPRKYLQLFSHFAAKALSLLYLGNKVECPVCSSHYRKFLPYGRQSRENALCPNCLSLERHRLIWLYLKNKTNFFEEPLKMLHIAPELCFIRKFESLETLDYITADIESPLAKIKMDAHDIPFKESELDVVFCNHVLEHVEDDRRVMREIHRVLRPGGWAVLQIPLFFPLREKTIEDPSVTDPKKREELFGQDDHVRMYGKDYPERLYEAGFEVLPDYTSELSEEELNRYAIDRSEILYVVKKN